MTRDTLDKIIKYFSALTSEPFTYKGDIYEPKPLVVSPLLIRGGFKCLPNCGGCCRRFSLDYLPEESVYVPDTVQEMEVDFNGRKVPLLRDLQKDHNSVFCRYLREEDGLCEIYPSRPFACHFEPVRIIQYQDRFELTQTPYNRGWNMGRVDGGRGALCVFEDPKTVPPETEEIIRKLQRLKQWMEHFGLSSIRISKVIEAIPFLRKGEQIRITLGVKEEGVEGKWIRFQSQ